MCTVSRQRSACAVSGAGAADSESMAAGPAAGSMRHIVARDEPSFWTSAAVNLPK